MRVPLSKPDIGVAEIDAVVEVLRSSQLSLGPKLKEFESAMATYAGVAHGVAVSSGTAGLHLALLAVGIGQGDEVIVPSFTFIAVANAVRYVGAVPVFVDIDPHTLNADPGCVEAAVTSRTRALLVVHTFGYPAPLSELMAIARRHGLPVIEDACEALGSQYRDRPVGSFGDVGVFAFYPNKQITTGEGGVVVTEDAKLAREMRALRNQGRYESDDWLQHSILGYNYRLSEMQCALGVVQMTRLPEILARRRSVAAMYRRRLAGHRQLRLPPQAGEGIQLGWFVYVVQLETQVFAARDAIFRRMQAGGIQCGRYFAPIHLQPAYTSSAPHLEFPVTEAVSRTTLALPFFSAMMEGQVDYVCAYLLEALAQEIGHG
jgi:perosamine synthetase